MANPTLLNRRATITGALALCGCASAVPPAPTRIGPAMWRAEAGGGRITLFGQTPISKGTVWQTPEVEAAFEAADELWVENPDYDRAAGNAIVQKRLAAGGPTLADALPASEKQRLAATLALAKLPTDALDKQPPWLAYSSLTNAADQISAMDPASLPERILKKRAVEAGKPVKTEWASIEEVMAFSAEASLEQQVQMISKTLDEVMTAEELAQASAQWASGDLSSAEARAEHFRAAYPALAARMTGQRNAKWAVRLKKVLDRRGTAFVCVGLGHLLGPDSIQAKLAAAGVKTERV